MLEGIEVFGEEKTPMVSVREVHKGETAYAQRIQGIENGNFSPW